MEAILDALDALIEQIEGVFNNATATSDKEELTRLNQALECLLMAGDALNGDLPKEAQNWRERMFDLLAQVDIP